MYIEVKTLMLLCSTILISVLLVVLIMVLANANRVVRKIYELLEQNQDNLANTLEDVPKLLENVNDLVVSGQDVVGSVQKTVDGVSGFVEEKTNEVATYSGIIGDLIQTILDIVAKFKK